MQLLKNAIDHGMGAEIFGDYGDVRLLIVSQARSEAVTEGLPLLEQGTENGTLLPFAAVDEDVERGLQEDEAGVVGLPEEEPGGLGFDRASAEGEH